MFIFLDKNRTIFFLLVDQESLKSLKTCLELNENVLNEEDILTFWSVVENGNGKYKPRSISGIVRRRESILEAFPVKETDSTPDYPNG